MITDYHACYYAHELSRVGGSGVESIRHILSQSSCNLALTLWLSQYSFLWIFRVISAMSDRSLSLYNLPRSKANFP